MDSQLHMDLYIDLLDKLRNLGTHHLRNNQQQVMAQLAFSLYCFVLGFYNLSKHTFQISLLFIPGLHPVAGLPSKLGRHMHCPW